MRGFLFFLYKEVVQFLRNWGLLIFVTYAFTLDVYIAAVSMDVSLKNASFYVQDYDNSPLSRELVSKFREPFFSFKGYVLGEDEIDELLLEDRAIGVIRIPPKFEERFMEGKKVRIGILVNGSEASASNLFSGYSSRIISDFLIKELGFEEKPLEVRRRFLFNQNADSTYFMGVSELLTVLTLLLVILPASAVIREKEMGNIEMVLISPFPTRLFFLTKSLAMTLVILIFTFLSLTVVIKGILGAPFRGSYATFLLITSVYAFATTGLGMFIASFARNMLQVIQLTMMTLMPMLYLSGTWSPIESMPKFFQYLSLLMPLRFYIESAFGIIFKGLGLSELYPNVIALLLIGGLLFVGGNFFISRRL
ncbi:ABC-2 type transport system permease protein [Hydrogenivirga caldilitoris]|uniref:ABC-2 type transport system permease protein n=1 Tax=Hydrogenivirga caldilitoris TaxID=246264 RepID=A0A497XMY0_9AQUI|nr:ABC transporter permease [Hydrogenivirga caldilitoris]RLJ70307.1 ABC-2 type transport system permease protein [Hydrogenivirga caldilitoris]